MKEILSNIVLFCGGANVKFLRENCPNERHKFYPIGLGVIITTVLGFISMMFATHSIFGANSMNEELVLILFSIFWAFAIFTIDWGLIKTMRKPKNEDPTLGDRIRTAVPVAFRLSVALIISFSISRPMEVKIYEKRLKAQIEKDRQAFVERELSKKDERVKEKTAVISDLTNKGDEYLAKKYKSPETETFKINLNSKKKCDDELLSIKAKNENKIEDLSKQYQNLGSPVVTPSAFGPPNDSTGIKPMLKWAKDKRWGIMNIEIPKLKNEIEVKQIECDGYAGKVTKEQEEYQGDYEEVIKANTSILSTGIANKDSIERANKKAIDEITKASYVSFDTLHPGLITQLESMSTFEETPEGRSVGWVRFILLLVIICIDTAPIVIKLLTKRGVYEAMQDGDEERMKFLIKQEGYSNNHLIQQLSLAQKEILTEAIRRWKINEKAREGMETDYVNSNQQDNGNESSR